MSKLLFSYHGAIGVRSFWLGLAGGLASVVLLSLVVGLTVAVGLIAFDVPPQQQEWALLTSSGLVAAYAVFTQLAVTIKRCHAVGRSGWWCLLTLIPFVGLAWLVFDLGIPRKTAI